MAHVPPLVAGRRVRALGGGRRPCSRPGFGREPGRGLGGPDHWTERAEALLGPLLHAAALGGKTMASVLRWVQRRDVQEALELAGSSNGHDVAADSIEGIMETEERERSGIFSTAANILSAYRLPAALQSASEPNFDPDAFVRSSDTV